MNEPVVTACGNHFQPEPLYDMLGNARCESQGRIVCILCGKNPFGIAADFTAKSAYETLHLPDSEGGEA